MRRISLLVLLSLFCSVMRVSAAERDPGSAAATTARSRETMKYYTLEQKEAAKKAQVAAAENTVAQEPSVTDESGSSDGKKIFVKEINVSFSLLVSNADIREIVMAYENKDVTIAQLNEMVAKINRLFKEKKQLTAKAYLPPQKIKDGVVQVALVEGRVGNVSFVGNDHTKSSYITKRFDITEGEVVDMKDLERKLFLFNRKNDVSLRAVMKPGQEKATTDLQMQVAEPKNFETLMYTDNSGGKSTGRERVGTVFTDKSLFGFRDQLTFGGLLAHGTKDGFFGYTVPINSYGTHVGFSHDNSRTSVRNGELKALKVTGESRDSGVYVTHPLIVEKKIGVNAFGGYDTKASSTAYDDFTVLAQKLRTVSYGNDLSYFGDTVTSEFRHYGTNGVHALNSDAEFFKYNAELTSFVQINEKTSSLLRSKFQYADTNGLPSGEQFQLGGVSTVRGYSEGGVSGDNGYFLSAELSRQFFDAKKVRFVLFYDHGGIINQKVSAVSTERTKRDSISGTGFGFNVDFTEQLSGRIYCGVPLDGPNGETPYQPVIHYDIQLKF